MSPELVCLKSSTLRLSTHGEAGEKHDRDGMPRQALFEPLGCVGIGHLTNGQRVVTHHPLFRKSKVSQRGPRHLIHHGEPNQESILFLLVNASQKSGDRPRRIIMSSLGSNSDQAGDPPSLSRHSRYLPGMEKRSSCCLLLRVNGRGRGVVCLIQGLEDLGVVNGLFP